MVNDSGKGIVWQSTQPVVVSVSRRTDVPAFYARWFIGRVRQGFCEWVNPFGGQRKRLSLRPEDVVAFVFWTRNPAPLMRYLDELEASGYTFYFHFTINGYPRALEPFNPPLARSIDRFRALADRVGPDRVFWRYDPMVLGRAAASPGGTSPRPACHVTSLHPSFDSASFRLASDSAPEGAGAADERLLVLDADYHRRRFQAIARRLSGYTRRCYFSFVSLYGKTRRNLKRAGFEWEAGTGSGGMGAGGPGVTAAGVCQSRGAILEPGGLPARRRRELAGELAAIGAEHGITLYACCDDALVGAMGEGSANQDPGGPAAVRKARCVDPEVLGRLRPDLGLCFPLRPTRDQCGCAASVDIGAYDTCLFGCAYCYATRSTGVARRRRRAHDPTAAALLPGHP